MKGSDDEYFSSGGESDELSISSLDSFEGEEAPSRDKRPRSTRSNTRSRGRTGTPNDLKGASGGYSWEDQYQRSWEITKEADDESQSLEAIIQTMIENRKKKIMKNPTIPFQRGIIRTLIVIVDGSEVMLERDLRPNRFSMVLSLLQDFVVEFFDQNPISQLGIVMTRNGIATLVSEVGGLPQYHLDKLKLLRGKQNNRYEPKGNPSLQNSLEMARSLLKYNFGSAVNDTKNCKEILLIFGALFTSDPGDIHQTIDNLVKDEIRVKVIGLSAQVAVCQELVNKTNNPHVKKDSVSDGPSTDYGIVMNEAHFRELLMDCVVPLPVTTSMIQQEKKGVPLIKMGFPKKTQQSSSSLSSNVTFNVPQLCACHLEVSKSFDSLGNPLNSGKRNAFGYQCPQCYSRVCHLPIICPVCGLVLILSTHLARSYHHLVPLPEYKEVPPSQSYKSLHCYGCLLRFPSGPKESAKKSKIENITSSRYRCTKCQHDFCIDCDVFVHETLHNCPGCESNYE